MKMEGQIATGMKNTNVQDVKKNVNSVKRNPPVEFQGIPFKWAVTFTAMCLISIFIGHYLTIRGQDILRNMQQQNSKVAPTILHVDPPKIESKVSEKVEQALGTIADSIDGTSQNMNKLVDAFDLKLAKVQKQISELGDRIDSIPKGKEDSSQELEKIRTALASLKTSVSSNNNVETIVSSIQHNAVKQGEAFRQLTSSVQELQKVVKDRNIAAEIKVNSTLGERFPPPK
jgi:methyl-accepting chemotaxis protein